MLYWFAQGANVNWQNPYEGIKKETNMSKKTETNKDTCTHKTKQHK